MQYAQDKQNMFNPVNYSVTSLAIPTDASSTALGDNGVATPPNLFSQHWNPAKYAFVSTRAAVGHSYTPWLRTLVNDIHKINTIGYVNWRKSTISASGSFFNLGEVYLDMSDDAMTIRPKEYYFDIAYSHRINSCFSLALAARYIRSDITYDYTAESKPGNAVAFDIAEYYQKGYPWGGIAAGGVIKNIGTKLSYGSDDNSEFIPTDLSLGAGIMLNLHPLHRLGLFFQADKLLVPTYPMQKRNEPDEEYTDRVQRDYYDLSSIKGIFKSFSDAPDGFKEEVHEITCAIGVEYFLINHILFRSGYHYEHVNKGNRKYVTFGLGLTFKPIDANISYVISTVKSNPLDKTFHLDIAVKIPPYY